MLGALSTYEYLKLFTRVPEYIVLLLSPDQERRSKNCLTENVVNTHLVAQGVSGRIVALSAG